MEYFDLTIPQQNIWNLQTYYSDTAIVNLCGATFYSERRNSIFMQQAIRQFIRSQSGIRLRFCEGKEPKQYVSNTVNEDIPVMTFSSMEEFDHYAEKIAREPLALTGRFMYKFVVFHVKNRSGILVLLSHLISDAWTFGLMAKQLDEAYHKLAVDTEDAKKISLLKADYIDYIHSETNYMASERYIKDRNYWEEKYADCPQESLMKMRSVSSASISAKRIIRRFPLSLEQRINVFCKTNSVTPAVLFEAALIIYLYKINPENSSITIGVPVLNRSNAREKEIAGMFISTMPLTVTLSEDMTGLMLAKQITREHMDIFRHQKYPYANILKYLREKYKISRNLYSVMVSYQNAKTDTQADTKWYSNGYSEVPFVLHIDNRDGNNSHTLNVDFQTDVFQEEEVDYIIKRLEYILEQITENGVERIKNIHIVPKQEWEKVVYEFNDTYVEYPKDKCVHELFSEQAEKTPDKIALVFEDKKFTYKQLDEMSNSLAYFLREKGVQTNDVVPIISKRSWHVIVAILGIMKAGGAYIPVACDCPPKRIQSILNDTKSKIMCEFGYGERLEGIEVLNIDNFFVNARENIKYQIDNRNKMGDTCYLIYTSGSTGIPKGTIITHHNLYNYLITVKKTYKINHFNMSLITNISVDLSITTIFLPLITGGVLEVINNNLLEGLKHIINKKNSVYKLTPTHIDIMHNMKLSLPTNATFIIGGEKLKRENIQYICQSGRLLDEFGPTETTVGSCIKMYEKNINDYDISIGKPIANTQIYILNRENNLLPIGVVGELCIAGEGVGKGYLNRPELTAERFVPNPFATEKNHHGKVLYHTGDLARWRADGEIEYLGRMDSQVKIRGLRIELEEIESVMGTMEDIGLVAVTDKRDENNRQYLAGYYTAKKEIEEKKLREHLAEKLPGYMIPNYFMRLDNMPMTPSGKIDRKNLPIPDYTVSKKDYIAPVTDTEKKLADIWQRILHVKIIGKDDDFYELGGDSLLAISMLNEIGTEFSSDISIKDILEHTTLEQLAICIERSCGSSPIKVFHDKKYMLLPQQKAIYAVYSKDPDTLAYNMPARIDLPANIDRDRLKQSIYYVMECHKILKSHIQTEEDDIYGIYDENIHISFEEYKNGNEKAFIRPFRLEREPLIRVGFTEDSLLFDMHHIIADGASLSIILKDIIAAYEGESIPKPRAEYSDYSRYFYKLDTSEHKKYFKEMLKCDFEPLRLPGTKNAGQGGRTKSYHIPEDIFRKTKEYAGKNGLTDTMVFLGAYGILLSKYAAKKDILTSIILQNRTHTDTRDMVGMFVNTLPLHLAVKGRTQDYLQTVKQILLNLFRYQEIPFQDIANTVEMKDRFVVNTAFVYQGDGEKVLTLDGQELVPQFIDTHTAKFDFSMELTPLKSGCQMRLEYDLSRYDEQLMDKLADAYLRILSQLDKERIADISVLSEDEYHKVIEEFNDTYVEYPKDKCVHELFSEQAERTPEKVALVFEDKKFTYRQLDEMSNSLAHFLREKGVKPDDVVPIIAKRSWHVIVAMLGVLKAGGAYILIDDQYPMERILYLIRECKACITLTYTDMPLEIEYIDFIDLNKCDYKNNVAIIDSVNNSQDILCAIHTSGSTGVPKLTVLTHENIVHYISYAANLFEGIYQVIATTIITFDAFIQETLVALCRNVSIILANNDQIFNQTGFESIINRYENSFLFQTPTKLLSYIKNDKSNTFIGKIKKFSIGGEIFPHELYEKISLSNPSSNIFNIYVNFPKTGTNFHSL